MKIRPAQRGDEARLKAIVQACGVAQDGLSYEEWSQPTVVAELDGEVVGLAQALLGWPYSVVTEVAVLPAYQHRGVGPRLMEHLETVLGVCGAQCWLAFERRGHPVGAMIERWGGTSCGEGVGYLRRLR